VSYVFEGPSNGTNFTGTTRDELELQFDGNGAMSGTLRVRESVEFEGSRYECDSGLIMLTGRLEEPEGRG
jgi:hypothetical protein